MTTSKVAGDDRRRYVWEQRLHPVRSGQIDGIDGAVLAALRRGIGKEAGTVPEMWPYYQELNDRGVLTARLRAEHLALTVFGVHQQSKLQPMHQRGVGVGTAMAKLRRSDRFSEQAVERRFAAFATATSLAEAGTHLRGLINQLREIDQVLDYTELMGDLVRWQHPATVGDVRRRWGMQFFINQPKES
jgi:CRISPR system Cascade subunit CasB